MVETVGTRVICMPSISQRESVFSIPMEVGGRKAELWFSAAVLLAKPPNGEPASETSNTSVGPVHMGRIPEVKPKQKLGCPRPAPV